jgi:hypothetical protein
VEELALRRKMPGVGGCLNKKRGQVQEEDALKRERPGGGEGKEGELDLRRRYPGREVDLVEA